MCPNCALPTAWPNWSAQQSALPAVSGLSADPPIHLRQVLANSLAGAVLAAAARAAAAGVPPVQALAGRRIALHGAFLGHYACCCADTWSSELGVLRCAMSRAVAPTHCCSINVLQR